MALPTNSEQRKTYPITRGVLDYFPDAIAAVAKVSFVGNEQHNPGQEMHWDRKKSPDHADCITRHLLERGTLDDDGLSHSAKVAWRALALLQIEIEGDEKTKEQVDFTESRCILDGIEQHEKPSVGLSRPSTAWEEDIMVDQLIANGCTRIVAQHIVGGCTNPTNPVKKFVVEGTDHEYKTPTVYIAGPMRGYEDFNRPAFDAVRDGLISEGWVVISPADIDRAAGDANVIKEDAKLEQQRKYAYRDFHALHWLKAEEGDAIAMLPGWEKSTGATAEIFMARWLGLKILDAVTGLPLNPITISHVFDLNGIHFIK